MLTTASSRRSTTSATSAMKFFTASLASLALLASSALAQSGLTINTPSNPVVCQPLLLTWAGGSPPYYLSILPGNQPTAAALHTFDTQTGTSITWIVNFTAGTSLGLTIKDNTGATAQSAAFTVQPGDTSCLNTSGSTGTAGATTSAGSSLSGSSAPASTSSVSVSSISATTPVTSLSVSSTVPATTSIKPATTTSAPSAAASTSKSSGAAPVNAVNLGIAGMVGAAVVALLA